MKKARVVIGANFGDEGKGLVTDWLASQGAAWVVRFNGGANAGHTVVAPDGARHVFKHFGSGALCGIPTYLSKFFVCNPIQFFGELEELVALGLSPVVAAHPDCLVTTYVDMMVNQSKEAARKDSRHGSCGVGLHETEQRSRVPALKITLGDVWNEIPLEDRLRKISGKWAEFRCGESFDSDEAIATFVKCLQAFANYVQPMGTGHLTDPIFEGAQGLLLSQDNEAYRPHLTHSYTGMKNAKVLCDQGGFSPEAYYVSRAYLTRHGAGPLPGEDARMRYADNTNANNAWQGPLRFAPLDCTALHARIASDAAGVPYKLALTHCDQLAAPMMADVYFHGATRADVNVATAWV